jgi:hypothetical protein
VFYCGEIGIILNRNFNIADAKARAEHGKLLYRANDIKDLRDRLPRSANTAVAPPPRVSMRFSPGEGRRAQERAD